MLVHGNAESPFVVAVAVLEPQFCAQWAKKNGAPTEGDALAASARLNDAVMQDFARIAAEVGMQKFEQPRGVVLDANDWTVENELMTPSFKLKRQPLVKKYQKSIDELYKSLGAH